MAFKTAAVAVAADTNVQIAGESAGAVSTNARTSKIKFAFVFSSTPGVVAIAEDAASLTAGEGFPIFADADTLLASGEDYELVADESMWVRATEAGTLYLRWDGA